MQDEPGLPKAFIDLIDKVVATDFAVEEITDEDSANDFYEGMNFTLDFTQIKILYERKVFSTSTVLPKVQYLFGFRPKEGLCLLVYKKVHKHVLCDGPQADLNGKCFLINGFQFLLCQSDAFKVWGYIPPCPAWRSARACPRPSSCGPSSSSRSMKAKNNQV